MVVWNSSEPSATQNISSGQATILNNFQFLGETAGNISLGYYKFPSGLKMVWGETTISGAPYRVITYSVAQAFTTTTFTIQITRIAVDPSANTPNGNYLKSTDISNSGFRIVNADGVSSGFYWFAIGI